MSNGHDEETARQGRRIALVIAGAALLAILAPEIRAIVGFAPRYEILIYLFSLAAFFWALVVTWQLWQKTRK